ncbi:MAG TPA: cell division protein FtsA [Patescibacteria group bacterium]|nr:cell division protein FtsA [Patescibacteria group bacterium]
MRDTPPSYFFGLDVGTATVRCVVGMFNPEKPNELSVVGHGSARNIGMRKGVVVHIDDVTEAISHAVTEAERISGVPIKRATVNINGTHVSGINSKGVVAISAANREISTDDRYRAEEAATIMQLPPNREIIQVFAKNYRVDGQDNIKDPVGMSGVRLEVDTHIVTAATPTLKSLTATLERAHVDINHITVSSLAAAEAVLSRQQKESGTVLLDIGAGTTNLVVVEDGEIQHVAILPLGGLHITNDLAIGLKTDLDVAELVKVKHATLEAPDYDKITLHHNDKEYSFTKSEIHMITEARVDELFDYVDKELKKIGRSRKLPGGAVLVGGTAKLPGIADFAKEKLQLAARVGELQPLQGLVDVVDDPAFVTAIGLMQLDMLLMPDPTAAHGTPNQKALGMIEGLLRRLRKN